MTFSRRIAFGGIVCALSLVFLFMTIFPYGTIALAALAGMVFVSPALELGTRYGWACFGITLLLALILTPDPSAKVLFSLFFGYYPLIQMRINLWKRPVVRWLIKMILLNAALAVIYLISAGWLDIPVNHAITSQPWMMVAVVPLLNGFFVIYDIVLWHVIGWYRVRLHPIVQRYL